MAALQSTELARNTARVGVMRIGAFRIGFVPNDVEGETPGSQGGIYKWREEKVTETVWTLVT